MVHYVIKDASYTAILFLVHSVVSNDMLYAETKGDT